MNTKLITNLAILAFGLIACGEQYQGAYSGQAVLLQDSCGESDVGFGLGQANKEGMVDITVSMRKSGGGTEFLITEFKSLDGTLSPKTQTYIQGLRFNTEIFNDYEIRTTDAKYEIPEASRNKIMKNLNVDQLTDEDLEQLSYDEIDATGSITADRKKIESLQVDIYSQQVSSSTLIPCQMGFSITSDGLTLNQ